MKAYSLDPFLLALCLRPNGGGRLTSELGRLDEASWSRLVDQAIWLGVAPQLHFRLRPVEGLVPSEQLQRLRDVYLHCLLKNQAALEQLSDLLDEIRGAGLSVLVLKGAYLAGCIYEEAALRPMTDIDLLAAPGEAEAVQRHLLERGYEEAGYPESVDFSKLHHLTPLVKPGSVEVEVHHGLAPPGAPFDVDIDGLWARSALTSTGGLELPHPAPDDLLLHLCTHAAYDDQFRKGLPAACDIAVVVRRLGADVDWERLARTANADARARFAFAALHVAKELLEAEIPEAALQALAHDPKDDELVADAVAYALSTAEEAPVTVRAVGEARTARAKLTRLWKGLFPPPDTVRKVLGLPADVEVGTRQYAARLFDVVRRRGRQMLRLLAGAITRSSATSQAWDKERRRRMIKDWATGGNRPER